MSQPSLTIAVPCFAQADMLPALLDSLSALSFDELIILDDGNPEPIALSHSDPRLRIIRHPRNQGLAAARNTLLAEAHGDLMLFLDADVEVYSCSTDELGELFRDPKVAAATGHVIEAGGDSLANRWRRWFWRQDHGEIAGEVELAYGLCSIWRRRVLTTIGGFDAALRSHAEDIDVSLRAGRLGWKIWHLPSLVVSHRRCDSVRSLLRMVWKHSYYYSRVCRRHHHPLYRRALVNSLKWLPIAVGSSLRRHRDPALALLSIPACLLSILARLWAAIRR